MLLTPQSQSGVQRLGTRVGAVCSGVRHELKVSRHHPRVLGALLNALPLGGEGERTRGFIGGVSQAPLTDGLFEHAVGDDTRGLG